MFSVNLIWWIVQWRIIYVYFRWNTVYELFINNYIIQKFCFFHWGLSMYLNFSERRKSELIMLYWKRVMRSKSNIGFAFDTERHQQHLKYTQTFFPLVIQKVFKCLNVKNIIMIALKLIIGGRKYMVKKLHQAKIIS